MDFKRGKVVWIPLLFLMILPSLAMLVLGFQFQGQVLERIPVAITDEDNSDLSRSLVQMIEENDTFNVTLYTETEADLENAIQKGTVAVGVIIPEHFESRMMTGSFEKILVVCDNVQLSAAGTAKGKISEVLGTLNTSSLTGAMARSLRLPADQMVAMAQPLGLTTQLLNPGKSMMIFSMHGSLLSMVQIAVFILALEITRRRDMLRPSSAIKNAVLCGAFGTLSATMVLVIQVNLFHFPFYGSKAAALILLFLYLSAIASLAILMRLMNKEKEKAVEFISILMAMMILSGYSYAICAMPKALQLIAPFIPFTHYGIPLRDIMLMGYGLADVLPDIGWIIGFIVLLWSGIIILGIKTQRRSKHVKAMA